jgi:hypothetical protein
MPLRLRLGQNVTLSAGLRFRPRNRFGPLQ